MTNENDELAQPREPGVHISESEGTAMASALRCLRVVSRKLQEVEAYGAMGKPHPDAIYVELEPTTVLGPNGERADSKPVKVQLSGLKLPVSLAATMAQAYRTVNGTELGEMFGLDGRASTDDGGAVH